MSKIPAAANPVLMSATNPSGWKLEDLMPQLAMEIKVKTDKIKHDTRPVSLLVQNNNAEIIEHLYAIERLQHRSFEQLRTLGPDEGPLGQPRIGNEVAHATTE